VERVVSLPESAAAVRRDRVGPSSGRLDDAAMPSVTRALAVLLGIA
jgi:hypothetical protein